MTNEELNFRLQVCAEAGLPYSDKLWAMLASAWDRGYAQGREDSSPHPQGPKHSNPYRPR